MSDGAGTDLRSFEGRVINDRYLLTKWIGGGAFGAVFLSEQRILGRPVRRVACKISRDAGMTEEDAREKFADILRLAEAMDGMTDSEARRHLVHVYDGGLAHDAGGRAFLVMEFVQGTTLAAQFATLKTVPAKLLFNWARQICVALRGLHALDQPLLHRDLKPDNVLLGSDLTVRLIDFGLAARLLESGTVPGVAGTLTYMAPETSQGQSVPASDLYSLGVLMYEGLTGRLPYEHLIPPPGMPDTLHGDWLYEQKRVGRAVAPPSRLNNTVTRETDAVVLRCLEFDPARRFRSAAELWTRWPWPRPVPIARRPAKAPLSRPASRPPTAIRPPRATPCAPAWTPLGEAPARGQARPAERTRPPARRTGRPCRLRAAARRSLAAGAQQRPAADPEGTLRPAVACGGRLPAGRERLSGNALRGSPAAREGQG